MPCNHRFLKELNPDWEINYLFVGTFNPEWNYNNAHEADYFYGRSRNNFWCILPRVFGEESLKEQSKEEKIKFLKRNKIGITDLISCINNANEKNDGDIKKITEHFSDHILNKYDLEFNVQNIIKTIENNPIKGVFLTRSTLNGIGNIAREWQKIVDYCMDKKIHCERLMTPAPYRGGCERKVDLWKNKIIK